MLCLVLEAIYKNGVATGLTVTVGAGATGVFTVAASQAFAADDQIDVGVTGSGLNLQALLSATVELV